MLVSDAQIGGSHAENLVTQKLEEAWQAKHMGIPAAPLERAGPSKNSVCSLPEGWSVEDGKRNSTRPWQGA